MTVIIKILQMISDYQILTVKETKLISLYSTVFQCYSAVSAGLQLFRIITGFSVINRIATTVNKI